MRSWLFFFQALQNGLWERKWAQWEGVGIINQRHKNAPFPLLTPWGGARIWNKHSKCLQGCTNTVETLGKFYLSSFSFTSCWLGGSLAAGFCVLAGGGHRLNQTSLCGHCALRMVKNPSLCSKWMNANCLRSSLLIRLSQCGRRKSFGINCSDQQKGLCVGQLEAHRAFLLYLCLCQHKSTRDGRPILSHLSCLP